MLALLAGCGGGGGGGEPTPGPEIRGNFFPLAVGDLWIYDDGHGMRGTVRATEAASVGGQAGVRVVTEAAGQRSEAIYVVTPGAVREVPVAGSDPVVQALGPIDLMRLPLRAGDSFVQFEGRISSGEDFDGDGRPEPADVRSVVSVVGVETANTPAGAYPGSLHLRTALRADLRLTSMAQTVTVDVVTDDWYAPDIGPVRSAVRITAGDTAEETALAVVAWKVGTRRSESAPPAAVEFTPAADLTQGQTSFVRVRFDEPLDPASAAGSLSLRDAAGAAVAGTVDIAVDSVSFTPVAPLTSGRYTARVAPSVADLLGNAVGSAREWSFTIDASGPQIVAVTPALGAVDVPRDTAITVRYDELLATDSLNATNVSLYSLMSGWATISVAISGDTVTVTPAVPLDRGVEYTLTIGTMGYGPRDRYGNFGASLVAARFTTDFGRFGLPQALVPWVEAEAVAIGDVNGDGRADVVIAVAADPDPMRAMHLGVWPQKAGGGLDAAGWIATRASYGCRPTAVAIGDVNGDGRLDAVVAEYGCGVEVFLQDAAGLLQPGPFLPSAGASYLVRIADFDGDGRQDVMAVGWTATVAKLWKQDAGGVLVEAVGPAIETQGWGTMAVGDLDGDGRPDVAVTSGQGDRAKALGVALQRSDGSFGPALYAAGTRYGGAFPGVAIGDVDGDGRAELLAAIDDGRIGVWRIESGALVRVREITTAEFAGPLRLGDMNGDGRLDVVVAHTITGGLGLYLQQPGGTLGAEVRYAGSSGYNSGDVIALADLSGDGRLDILIGASMLLQRPVPVFAEGVRKPGPTTLLQRVLGGAARR